MIDRQTLLPGLIKSTIHLLIKRETMAISCLKPAIINDRLVINYADITSENISILEKEKTVTCLVFTGNEKYILIIPSENIKFSKEFVELEFPPTAESIPTRRTERTKGSETTATAISINTVGTFAIENISTTGIAFAMSSTNAKAMKAGTALNATIANGNNLSHCRIKIIRVQFSIIAIDEIDAIVSAMFINEDDNPATIAKFADNC